MYYPPLASTEHVAFRHGVGGTTSRENEAIYLALARCLEDMAAFYPDRAREARRPPCPPSNGAPNRR